MADNIQSAKAAFFSLFRWNDECADCDCQKARNKKQKIELRTYTAEAKRTPDQRTEKRRNYMHSDRNCESANPTHYQ